jgi:hypothetical protein
MAGATQLLLRLTRALQDKDDVQRVRGGVPNGVPESARGGAPIAKTHTKTPPDQTHHDKQRRWRPSTPARSSCLRGCRRPSSCTCWSRIARRAAAATTARCAHALSEVVCVWCVAAVRSFTPYVYLLKKRHTHTHMPPNAKAPANELSVMAASAGAFVFVARCTCACVVCARALHSTQFKAERAACCSPSHSLLNSVNPTHTKTTNKTPKQPPNKTTPKTEN